MNIYKQRIYYLFETINFDAPVKLKTRPATVSPIYFLFTLRIPHATSCARCVHFVRSPAKYGVCSKWRSRFNLILINLQLFWCIASIQMCSSLNSEIRILDVHGEWPVNLDSLFELSICTLIFRTIYCSSMGRPAFSWTIRVWCFPTWLIGNLSQPAMFGNLNWPVDRFRTLRTVERSSMKMIYQGLQSEFCNSSVRSMRSLQKF